MNKTQIRRAGPNDAAALTALVAGLSLESAFRRFFAGVATPSPRFVTALLRRDATHGAWLCTHDGELVGHACWGHEDGAAEVGVVVADAWQGQGLGRSLLTTALVDAARSGLTDVRLHVHTENRRLARLLSAGAVRATREHDVVTITRPMSDLLGESRGGQLLVA